MQLRDRVKTKFALTLYNVVAHTENSLVISSPDGVQYSRNASHVHKYEPLESEVSDLNMPETQSRIIPVDISSDSGESQPKCLEPERPSSPIITPERQCSF